MGNGQMGNLPSTGQHNFSVVPKAEIQRSTFDRSHGYKTTMDSGYLVPIYVDEALPGDTFSLTMSSFARLSTPIKPVMDNLYFDTFFFAVPIRIIWDNFKKFMGEQINPGDSISYLVPTITSPAGGPAVGSLADYMGIPTAGQITGTDTIVFNALHFRAYNKIYNAWFRDENIINSVKENQGDGPDTYSDYSLLRRGKRHDYFTSCLPWPQKGSAVSLPLGTYAPIVGTGMPFDASTSASNAVQIRSDSGTLYQLLANSTNVFGANNSSGSTSELKADLTNATAATINALRQAFQVQKLLERDARGGTRYIEIVKSHFNVTSPDARFQRPEYLGGGSQPINFHPVASTVDDQLASGLPQGNLAATATSSHTFKGFTKSFTEHCVIIGLGCLRADLNYQQGLNRMWSRQTRYDFYWPALAHIGEQAVLTKEIYARGTGTVTTDADIFGYQERAAEYRYKPSLITGKYRSTAAATLDVWHAAQKFTSAPTLSPTFINETPPISRLIAVPTEPEFYLDCYFRLKCARPMPVYSVPGLVDHF